MKKNITKIIMAALVAATMLALAACGSKTVGGNDSAKTDSTVTQPSESVAESTDHKITFILESTVEGKDINVNKEFATNAKTLGDFLRSYEDCTWEDAQYGLFVHGFNGIENDDSQEIWWELIVNGESAMEGADFYEIKDGDEYKYVLRKGYDW